VARKNPSRNGSEKAGEGAIKSIGRVDVAQPGSQDGVVSQGKPNDMRIMHKETLHQKRKEQKTKVHLLVDPIANSWRD